MIRKITLLLLLVVLVFCKKSVAQSSPCPPNVDFEYGSFFNWTCYTGTCCSAGVMTFGGPVAPVNGRHNITTGAGTDYYGGFPIVAPGGGSYSARIGYDTTGLRAERIRYYVRVPAGAVGFDLVYRYAIVLELPPSGHSTTQEPRFDVTASDSATGVTIPCASYNYVSSAGLPGFVASAHPARQDGANDVQYRTWNTATLNLTGLGGTTVAIDFSAGDCSLGGHFGYAYVDMSCGLFQVQGLTCNDTATHVTLSAPSGFEFYHWYDSTTGTLLGTTQTVIIAVPGGPETIEVVLSPFAGFGCPDTLYTHLSPSNLQLNPMHDTLICNSDSITLNSGATDIALPLSYSWSGPGLSCFTCATPVAHPPAGINVYSVSVTNLVGCVKDTTITVSIDNFTTATSKYDDTCHNGNIGWASVTVLSGQPPFSYLWSTTPPQTTSMISGLYGNGPSGFLTYTVTTTDNIGCRIVNMVNINDGQPTDLYVVAQQGPSTCDGSDGFIVLDSLVPGHTFLIGYDTPGVSLTQAITANALWCGTLVNLRRGAYSNIHVITDLTITTPHCPYNIVGPVTLADPLPPMRPVMGNNSPFCVGTELYLSALTDTGATYTWSGPAGFTSLLQNPTINPTVFPDSGLYKVVVMRKNCFDSNTTRVFIKPLPLPSAGSNSPVCSGDTLKLTAASADGASYFIWTGPNGFYANAARAYISPAQVAATGTYTITAVLAGCDSTITMPAVVNQTPGPPAVADTEYCQKGISGPFNAFPDTGNTLLWYATPAGGTASGIAPTPPTLNWGIDSAYVSQVSPAGCEGPRALITAQIDYLASPSLKVSDSVICRQGDIQFSALNTGSDMTGITWTFGDGHNYDNSNPIVHSFTGTGVFTVTATALYKVCPEEIVSRVVIVFPSPDVYLGNDTSICPGGEAIILNASNSTTTGAAWKWNTGAVSSSIRVTTPGTYYVEARIDGCASTDTIVVAKDCYLDIPNVFTPNGDGMNDYFFPRQMLTKGLTTFSMQIYNRWGQEIFASTSLDGRGWDGRFNDVLQPEGVYVYVIEATFKDGQKEHHQGNVTLLR